MLSVGPWTTNYTDCKPLKPALKKKKPSFKSKEIKWAPGCKQNAKEKHPVEPPKAFL